MNSATHTATSPDRQSKSFITLSEHAQVIKTLSRRMLGDVVEIGRRLHAVKKIVGHSHFGRWVDAEFGWSPATALRFMQVETLATKNVNLTNLNLPLSGIYALAAPGTPEHVIEEVIEQAERGKVLSLKAIREMIPRKDDVKTKRKSSVEIPASCDPVADVIASIMRLTLHQRRELMLRMPGLVSMRDITPKDEGTKAEAPKREASITNSSIIPPSAPVAIPARQVTYSPDELKARTAALLADIDETSGIPRFLRIQNG